MQEGIDQALQTFLLWVFFFLLVILFGRSFPSLLFFFSFFFFHQSLPPFWLQFIQVAKVSLEHVVAESYTFLLDLSFSALYIYI